jgi:uncharacterized protein (DUF1499 family)
MRLYPGPQGNLAIELMIPQEKTMLQSLPPCPSSPNCVCSYDLDSRHFIEPIHFHEPALEAWERWLGLLRKSPGLVSLHTTDDTARIVFQTRLFRFKDDCACVLDAESQVIHLRSASRLGYSDFGVNRRRLEHLRSLFASTSR